MAGVGALAAFMQGKLSLKDFEWPQAHRPSLSTTCNDTHLIPEIDLQSLLHPHHDDERKLHELQLLRDAVSTCGFFQVHSHSISISALETLHFYAKKFYSMPLELKLQIAESLGSLIEGHDSQSGYTCGGRLDSPVKWWFEALRVAASNKRNILAVSKCLWVEESDQQAFGDALEECANGFTKLARQLTGVLLQVLGVDAETVLKEYVDGEEESLGVKLNHYPACPQPEKTAGRPSHTDISLVTVLWQDAVGGLQVQREGRWIAVKPRPDALVVNIGDILQVWSNDHFKSGFHRVLLNSIESRYSIVCFYNPSSKSILAPVSELLKIAGEPPKFQSMLTSEYRKHTFKQISDGNWQGVEFLRN